MINLDYRNVDQSVIGRENALYIQQKSFWPICKDQMLQSHLMHQMAIMLHSCCICSKFKRQ